MEDTEIIEYQIDLDRIRIFPDTQPILTFQKNASEQPVIERDYNKLITQIFNLYTEYCDGRILFYYPKNGKNRCELISTELEIPIELIQVVMDYLNTVPKVTSKKSSYDCRFMFSEAYDLYKISQVKYVSDDFMKANKKLNYACRRLSFILNRIIELRSNSFVNKYIKTISEKYYSVNGTLIPIINIRSETNYEDILPIIFDHCTLVEKCDCSILMEMEDILNVDNGEPVLVLNCKRDRIMNDETFNILFETVVVLPDYLYNKALFNMIDIAESSPLGFEIMDVSTHNLIKVIPFKHYNAKYNVISSRLYSYKNNNSEDYDKFNYSTDGIFGNNSPLRYNDVKLLLKQRKFLHSMKSIKESAIDHWLNLI